MNTEPTNFAVKNFYEGKNVLVAGGTGTIGMQLVPELIKRGAVVTAVTLDSEEYADAVLPEFVRIVQTDLTSKRMCLELTEGKDIVFDMAGIKGSTTSNSKQYSKVFVNYLRFQTELMDASAKNRVSRYLYAGSQCEYPQMSVPKKEENMWDALPVQNDKYSGLVKRVGEIQANAYYEEGSWDAVRIIRLSNVYGPGDDFNPATAQVIPALIGKALASKKVDVNGDGSAIRDFIYSEDAAFWSAEAIENLAPCVPTNISAGRGISIREVCDTIQEFLDVEFVFHPTAYSGDAIRILSTERAARLLSFYQRTTFREGIQETIEWYKENKDVAALKGKFYGR